VVLINVGLPSPKRRGWPATARSAVRQPTEPGETLARGRGDGKPSPYKSRG
jgi:hypothetical protein